MPDRRPLLMLIDGPSLVYRGYFALPPLTMSDGTLVNAVFGFLQIVLRGMQDVRPDFAIVSFDVGKPQFRFDAFPDYKKGRPSMPDDLRAQFPIVREITAMMGMPVRELEGYEADDVIGTLTEEGHRAGRRHDDRVRRPRRAAARGRQRPAAHHAHGGGRHRHLRRGHGSWTATAFAPTRCSTTRRSRATPRTTSRACREWGRRPPSACSSSSGRSTASTRGLDEVKGKLRDRLAEHRESAFMSREIGRIITDLPVELGLEEARTGRYDRRAVAQRFRELEFRSLIDRLPASSIAPTGHDSPSRRRPAACSSASTCSAAGAGARPATEVPPRERPDPLADPGGSIEHVDPRIARSTRDLDELEGGWRGTVTPSASAGWSAAAVRSSDGCSGSRSRPPTAAPGTSPAIRAAPPWSGCRPSSCAPTASYRSRPEAACDHALGRSRRGARRHLRRHARCRYMVNQALRSQTIEDLAAQHFGAELPPKPVNPETGAEEQPIARRAAAEALTALLALPILRRPARGGRPGAVFRRGRDAAPPGAGADGEGRREDRPRGPRPR